MISVAVILKSKIAAGYPGEFDVYLVLNEAMYSNVPIYQFSRFYPDLHTIFGVS